MNFIGFYRMFIVFFCQIGFYMFHGIYLCIYVADGLQYIFFLFVYICDTWSFIHGVLDDLVYSLL